MHDLLNLAYAAPFHRSISDEEGARHIQNMKDRWDVMGLRFEEILAANGGKHMVGTELTYADILIGHCITWFVEEVSIVFFYYHSYFHTSPFLTSILHVMK